MDGEPRHTDLSSAFEGVEARSWISLSAVTGAELLFDDRGMQVGTALFSDASCALANRVVGLGLGRPVQGQLLDQVIDMYEAAGSEGPIFIPTAPTARPATLPRMLRDRGFEPAMKEAKLYRNTKDPPAKDPRDRVVKAVEADHEVVASLYRAGGMHADWSDVMAANLGAPGWHHYMALDGDRPVALASMFESQGYALCFPGWTLPSYRHRGYQRALAAHRVAAAGEMGCEWVSINVDVTEGPIGFTTRSYTRLGFELLYVRTTHIKQLSAQLPNAYSRRLLIPNN